MEIEELWELIDRCAPFQFLPENLTNCDEPAPFLAKDIYARMDMPAFDHSSMDGFAFADAEGGWHPIVLKIAAGDAGKSALPTGHAARVLTGAPVPTGTLFVAKQEDCEVEDGRVRLRTGLALAPGENIRRRGEVMAAGEVVLRRGHCVDAGTLALLAAMGIESIPQQAQLSALHIATGDELISPGQPLEPGKIYDSNGPMIQALLVEHHVDCQRVRVTDARDLLEKAVKKCASNLLLISGGSGPGDRDYTHQCLEDADFTIHASRINSRPGKPLIFATRGRQVAFGMPGNPLAHWVCFHAFVARAIARMQGQEAPALLPVELEQPIEDVGDGRRTWTPAYVSLGTGKLMAAPLRWAHSGDLRPLAEANALLLDGQYAILTSYHL